MKTDAQSQEIREKYQAHVARMFELIGDPPRRRRKTQPSCASRPPWQRLPHPRRAPRSLQALPQAQPRPAPRADPVVRLDRYLADKVSAIETINVSQPAFFKAIAKQLQSVPLAHGRLSALARGSTPGARTSRRSSWPRTSTSTARPAWREGDPPALEALRPSRRPRPRGGARPGVRPRTFTAETKQKTIEMTQQIERAMETRSETARLDDRQQTKQRALDKLQPIAQQGRLSRPLARLLARRRQPRRLPRQRPAGRRSSRPIASCARSASPSTAASGT